jgi:hypothetical protein
MLCPRIGDQPARKRLGQTACAPCPSNGFMMAAQKQSRPKGGRATQAAPAAWRFSIVLSTAARSCVDMTVTAELQSQLAQGLCFLRQG